MNTRARDLFLKRLNRGGSYAILIIVGIMVITPIVWLLLSSFKDDSNFMAWPIQILPAVWRWVNYNKVFTLPSSHFVSSGLRTVVVGVLYSAGLAISSAMGGYAFARYQDVKANHRLFRVIIVLLIVPGIVFLIPQFMLFSYMHIIPNTYWPWVLWALTGSPLYIFLYRQFFLGFPKELEEAAELDGCGPFRVFWQILLPNSKPVIATVSIFAFSGIWGDYITPMLFLSQKMTLMGVTMATNFVDPRGNALRTVSFAGTVLYVLPLIILFFIGQKYILKGLITSGLKG